VIFLDFEIVSGLEIHPETLRCPKVARQTQRCVCGNSTLPMDDFVDSSRRNGDVLGQSVLSDTHRFQELLEENLTRMNWPQLFWHGVLLMIVDDLDVVGSPVFPEEADAPLVVHADTVLPLSFSNKFLKSIGRRNPEVDSRFCSIQDQELPKSDALNGHKFLGMTPLKDLFGFTAAEALDHELIIPPRGITVKRYQVA